ncbi:MAG TPA: hypothetical protein VFC80_05415, partial [Sphaerochaeta sp.]|nr:hypothetical protein [Sphaerochaeta sp.]
MSIPLDSLIDYEGNIYQMTCVAIKEANLISTRVSENEGGESTDDKIVSTVLTRALAGEISFET